VKLGQVFPLEASRAELQIADWVARQTRVKPLGKFRHVR